MWICLQFWVRVWSFKVKQKSRENPSYYLSPEENHEVRNTCGAWLYEIRTWSTPFKFICWPILFQICTFLSLDQQKIYLYMYICGGRIEKERERERKREVRFKGTLTGDSLFYILFESNIFDKIHDRKSITLSIHTWYNSFRSTIFSWWTEN